MVTRKMSRDRRTGMDFLFTYTKRRSGRLVDENNKVILDTEEIWLELWKVV